MKRRFYIRSVPFAAMLLAMVAVLGAGWKTAVWWSAYAWTPAESPGATKDHRAADPVLPRSPSAAVGGMSQQELRSAMAEEEANLAKTRATIESLCAKLGISPEEDIVSLGRYETLAAEGLQFVSAIGKIEQSLKGVQAEKQAPNRAVAMETIHSWVTKAEIIGRLEDDPEKIARLAGAAIEAMVPLDASSQHAVRKAVGEEFQKLKALRLTKSQRPAEQQKDWYRARDAALKEAAQRIEAWIPAERRKPYLVEQVLHFGTGMRAATSVDQKREKGSLILSYELPGMAPYRL